MIAGFGGTGNDHGKLELCQSTDLNVTFFLPSYGAAMRGGTATVTLYPTMKSVHLAPTVM